MDTDNTEPSLSRNTLTGVETEVDGQTAQIPIEEERSSSLSPTPFDTRLKIQSEPYSDIGTVVEISTAESRNTRF